MAACPLCLPSLACQHPSRRSLSLFKRLRIQAMKPHSDAGNRHENETHFSPLNNSSKSLSLATQLTVRSRAMAISNHRDAKTPSRFLRARTRHLPWPCLKRESPLHFMLYSRNVIRTVVHLAVQALMRTNCTLGLSVCARAEDLRKTFQWLTTIEASQLCYHELASSRTPVQGEERTAFSHLSNQPRQLMYSMLYSVTVRQSGAPRRLEQFCFRL